MARLFDPDSAPAAAGNDVLGWLAGWFGLAYERRFTGYGDLAIEMAQVAKT